MNWIGNSRNLWIINSILGFSWTKIASHTWSIYVYIYVCAHVTLRAPWHHVLSSTVTEHNIKHLTSHWRIMLANGAYCVWWWWMAQFAGNHFPWLDSSVYVCGCVIQSPCERCASRYNVPCMISNWAKSIFSSRTYDSVISIYGNLPFWREMRCDESICY